MTNKPLVLFDLDGTLFDTAPEFLFCLNKMLKAQNKPPLELNQLRQEVSNGGNAMLKLAFNILPNDKNFDQLKNEFLDIYEQHLGKFCAVFDGIFELLDFLDASNIGWGIVTNKPSRFALPSLDKFSLTQRAKHIVCADMVKNPKPSPEPLLLACKALQVDPKNCWYVGDSIIDVKASKAANIRIAFAEYGYFPQSANIQSWNADFYFRHPNELMQFFSKTFI